MSSALTAFHTTLVQTKMMLKTQVRGGLGPAALCTQAVLTIDDNPGWP